MAFLSTGSRVIVSDLKRPKDLRRSMEIHRVRDEVVQRAFYSVYKMNGYRHLMDHARQGL